MLTIGNASVAERLRSVRNKTEHFSGRHVMRKPAVLIAPAVVVAAAVVLVVVLMPDSSVSRLVNFPGEDLSVAVSYRPSIPPYKHGKYVEISEGKCDEFYEFYIYAKDPFITSDCLFHAYHLLLFDTVRQMERAEFSDLLDVALSGTDDALQKMCGKAKNADAARLAQKYVAIARRLLSGDYVPRPEVRDDVLREVEKIEAASEPVSDPQALIRDYTAFAPVGDYVFNERSRRYFRTVRFLTSVPLKLESLTETTAAIYISEALARNKVAMAAYAKVAQIRRFLGGSQDDLTPFEYWRRCRTLFREDFDASGLTDREVQQLVSKLKGTGRPRIADQVQDRPGADPSVGWGMRFLSGGWSLRGQLFQDIGQAAPQFGVKPSGIHVAYMLGCEQAAEYFPRNFPPAEAGRNMMAEVQKGDPLQDEDLFTAALHVLSRLNLPCGEGYPSFMRTKEWQIKQINAQLGGWSELEHDLFLNLKDNAYYLCAVMKEEGFHGYVEPVPEFFAELARLVHRTRRAFERIGVFNHVAKMRNPSPSWPWGRDILVATPRHYEILEELLLRLKVMAEKELEGKTLNRREIKLLKEFGDTLKHLAFNESNSPSPREPMSCIVPVVREYAGQVRLHVGVGRPLEIRVVVPYGGKLHYAWGAVYSYYEFWQPMTETLSDSEWKPLTRKPLREQEQKPWLSGKGFRL
jgi:hypothetical protein